MKKLLFILLLLLIPVSIFAQTIKPIKILIVPGHDNKEWGAEFNGVKEADMTEKLSLMIFDLLKKDKKFEPIITRDWNGYTPTFEDYFINGEQAITDFINEKKSAFESKLQDGSIQAVENIYHNYASQRMATVLYGINKWADENNVDAVIHVHFNDYPRPKKVRGEYTGFAVYVRDKQMNNSKDSYQLGSFVFQSLLHDYNKSNYPPEASGVVPDQNLIAIGEYNSSRPEAF